MTRQRGRPDAATLQLQARALGDPTRHEIFRRIAAARRPLSIAELTDRLAVHHNAVRQHLAKLLDAELVVETTAATGGPGRPRLLYEMAPTAEVRWGVEGPYERLSAMLAEVIRTGDPPEEVGRRAARRLVPRVAEGTLDVIVDTMARHGFDPEVRRRGGRVDVVLRRCPFESAALADPATVCALHAGLARGVAEGGNVQVDELVARDPRRAGCRLRLTVAAEPPDPTSAGDAGVKRRPGTAS